MKAFLKNYRQSPRKVRLVADLVRGKKTENALALLEGLPKRAALPIKKLIMGAISNATQIGVEKGSLYIKELRVDKGIVMKRMMPRAMGRGARINKRTSHVTIVLEEKIEKKGKIENTDKKVLTEKVAKEKKIVKEKKVVKKVIKKNE